MSENGAIEQIDTVVIGAGQAGLSAGYHLKKRGLPFVILDADARIGDHWRDRWDSLKLYSPARYDSLPGHAVPRAVRRTGRPAARWATTSRPTRAASTCRSAAAPASIASSRSTAASSCRPPTARIAARQVVVATGPFREPSIPAFAGELDPSIRQLHSHEYRNPTQLPDGPVLVVGLSHSGADIAFEAANAGHRTILSGKSHGQMPIRVTDTKRAMLGWPVVEFFFGHVAHDAHADGPQMRPEVRQGRRPAPPDPPPGPRPGRRRASRREDRRRRRTAGRSLADGTVLDVANVIWATGYRPDYCFVAAPIVGDDGWPDEVRGVSPTVPGLYFLGVPFQYAFSSMLVAGRRPRREVRRRPDRRTRRRLERRRRQSPVPPEVGSRADVDCVSHTRVRVHHDHALRRHDPSSGPDRRARSSKTRAPRRHRRDLDEERRSPQPGGRAPGADVATSGGSAGCSAACSRTWAVQPAWRASENVAGNRSGVRPTPISTGAA